MTTRFVGWTCLADRTPEPGRYTVGLAGSEDDQVWHASPCRWDGTHWFNRYDMLMPPSKPEQTFYKE